MNTMTRIASAVGLGGALIATATAAPFGGEADVAYAGKLWRALESADLVGAERIMSTPYKGTHPHGAVLDTIDARVAVDRSTDTVIIKNNYGGEGVSKSAVANDPPAFLQAITVMFKREGYDPENGDWFWVKYAPDGDVLTNPKGVPLAGRVGKGGEKGCIACHSDAPGGDLVFNHDRYAH